MSLKTINSVPKDYAYLTNDIGEIERRRIIKQDKKALYRAQAWNNNVEGFIDHIEISHFDEGLSAEEIMGQMIERTPGKIDQKSIDDLSKYIKKVIKNKKEEG